MAADPIVERFDDDGRFPNSRLPLLIYRPALRPETADADAMEAMFADNGWPPQWRSGIYPFHHYHSTAHEALGIARGSAKVMFGGPQGRVVSVAAGDVVVIPAGVAHCRMSNSDDFLVVGAYPPGASWDLLRGDAGDRDKAIGNIAHVPLPDADPVTGPTGMLPLLWA